ncbi:MAG: hypothetical protein P8P73_09105, partial [Flavobacteriaceae bacterium]|nr:hypothetical protein [Flavobacteriaceae bacterium]
IELAVLRPNGADGLVIWPLDLPTATIFIIIPIFTLVAILLAEVYFKSRFIKKSNGIDYLINEMEELRK